MLLKEYLRLCQDQENVTTKFVRLKTNQDQEKVTMKLKVKFN